MIEIRSKLKQELEHFVIPIAARFHKRGALASKLLINIHTGLDQSPNQI